MEAIFGFDILKARGGLFALGRMTFSATKLLNLSILARKRRRIH